METIAEPLELVCFLRLEIANGKSVRLALKSAFQSLQNEFVSEVFRWFQQRERGAGTQESNDSGPTQHLFHLLDLGAEGVPIHDSLAELESHMIEICKEDVVDHIEKLPVIMCVPMILCFLPAFMILIMGPALSALSLGLEVVK